MCLVSHVSPQAKQGCVCLASHISSVGKMRLHVLVHDDLICDGSLHINLTFLCFYFFQINGANYLSLDCIMARTAGSLSLGTESVQKQGCVSIHA